ncbi:GNAT family N-acetyltransferase [Neisseriaceae bacterium JH1-16]|nr:GNAT family N-acetyltransferase [Neisseriaceae bacterium JH1-16]
MSYRLQALAEADLPACHALFVASVHGLASRFYSAEQCAAWAPAREMDPAWRAGWAERLGRAWSCKAVSDDGQLAGFAWLCHDGEFDMLFVAPEYAGQGLALWMIAALEAEAQAAGLTEFTTWASHGARPVFERAGYRWLRDNRVLRHGVEIDNCLMRKSPATASEE